ncbi:MAG: hypothetical protein FWG25_08855 [Promicromonosporaceae bacterium]|nr:hypothetical protein [Promicromonosporaceae bacterium]
MFELRNPAIPRSAPAPRRLTRMFAAGTLLSVLGAPVFALSAVAVEANVIELDGERRSGTDWEWDDDGVITVRDTNGDGVAYVVVQGVASGGTRIVVAEDTKAIIELNGAEIDVAAAGYRGAKHGIELLPGADVEVQLREGTSSILNGAYSNGPSGGAGIFVPQGTSLKITAPGAGTGELTATGWVAMPGIGGGKSATSGDIQIDGGKITATGGDSAAGIGSGWKGHVGSITIKGGDITATGGNGVVGRNGGAAIGTGSGGNGGPIVITGGKITANGVFGAAGIGSGYASPIVDILITGGDITAYGDGQGAGIGTGGAIPGGLGKGMSTIVITGADTSVHAISGRPEETETKEAIPGIGAGEYDNTRTETFFMVGGPLVINNEAVAKNVTLEAAEGSTGAVAMEVPKVFKHVPGNQVRLVRTLNPDASFSYQSTVTNQSIAFSTNGFNTVPETVKTSALERGTTKISFEPQLTAEMLLAANADAGPTGFWDANNPLMIGYVGIAVLALIATLMLGVLAAARRRSHYRHEVAY